MTLGLFVDPDITSKEAKQQQALHNKWNCLDSERQAENSADHHFGIRSGRVFKIIH